MFLYQEKIGDDISQILIMTMQMTRNFHKSFLFQIKYKKGNTYSREEGGADLKANQCSNFYVYKMQKTLLCMLALTMVLVPSTVSY